MGDCFVLGDATELASVRVLGCEEPHEAEVFARVLPPEFSSGSYPGDDEVTGPIRRECVDRFEAFVGAPYGDSVYDIQTLAPTSRRWSVGDRWAVCLIVALDTNGELTQWTGTARGP